MVYLINFGGQIDARAIVVQGCRAQNHQRLNLRTAAYTYCQRSHTYLAEELGVGKGAVPALLDNYEKVKAQMRKPNRPNLVF